MSEISKSEYIERELRDLAEMLELEVMEINVFKSRGAINIIAKFDE